MLAQAEKFHAVSRRRMAKSFTKCTHSKGNSLPPIKRFDFTMVDDDFEELQRGFAPKETNADTKKCVKLFKDLVSARNHHSSSTIKMVPNDSLLTDTALQLLEVIIHHDVYQTAWRVPGCCYENARKTCPFYVDSRLGTNCKSATHNSRIQQFKLPTHFHGVYFW